MVWIATAFHREEKCQLVKKCMSGESHIVRPTRRRGFSFVELLFAIMILGIGFIMIAAIFPVGLAQTKSNLDETKAASLARSMCATLHQQSASTNYSGISLQPMIGSIELDSIARSNSISFADPRYAVVPLYSPPADSGLAQVHLFVVTRSEPFTQADFKDLGTGVRSLEPRPVRFRINAGQIRFVGLPGSAEEANLQALAPGCFVLIASTPGLGLDDRERFQGRVYRLGSMADSALAIYDFMPGNEFEPDTADPDGSGPRQRVRSLGYSGNDWRTAGLELSGSGVDGTAYIIGRNRISPTTFEGTAMDVAYYTSLVRSAR